MNVKERMIAIRLYEGIRKHPEYAKTLGIAIKEDSNHKRSNKEYGLAGERSAKPTGSKTEA